MSLAASVAQAVHGTECLLPGPCQHTGCKYLGMEGLKQCRPQPAAGLCGAACTPPLSGPSIHGVVSAPPHCQRPIEIQELPPEDLL
jgi:hypothetical protein